jgi:hypothetical protein
MRAAVHPYPKLPGTNYGAGDVDPGLVRIVYVADLDLDRPRRLVSITRHQVSLVEEEPSSELLSSDRRRHRDVETVVSYFRPCDADDEASARGEPHQIAAVNLPVQQRRRELLELRSDRDSLPARFGRNNQRPAPIPPTSTG